MRILAGEPASKIPVSAGDNVRPIFEWRQMQRWGVPASDLPQGSEIRFHSPTVWEQYRWQSLTAMTIILVQALLIAGLFYERERRRLAEIDTRRRMSELAGSGLRSGKGAAPFSAWPCRLRRTTGEAPGDRCRASRR